MKSYDLRLRGEGKGGPCPLKNASGTQSLKCLRVNGEGSPTMKNRLQLYGVWYISLQFCRRTEQGETRNKGEK